MKILITAGPTREKIDPVRFITNFSSGKMGYSLAAAAVKAGHKVTLVSGPVSIVEPAGLSAFISVESAAEMADTVKRLSLESDVVIMAAAVADYRPVKMELQKIKKHNDDNMHLELEKTEDIIASLGKIKNDNQVLAGFAAETQNLKENALKKLKAKNLDWIIANDVSKKDRGFDSDKNAVTMYSRNGTVIDMPLEDKKELAEKIISIISSK